jgi:DNA-binding NtrC family response regulator
MVGQKEQPVFARDLIGKSLEHVERIVIQGTLARLKGNKTHTARSLGISLKTLYNKLAQYEGRAT